MKRALTPTNIRDKKRKLYKFTDKWLDCFGEIEKGSRILIYGESGQGKTSFTFQLGKYLSKFGKVGYNSLELGDSLALENALNQSEIKNEIMIYDRETIEQLTERLKKQKSADIVIIDSLQYLRDENGNGITYKRYLEFTKEFSHKTLIFISHGRGNNPLGRLAEAVKFDCDCKVFVKGFKANIISRYGGGESIIVWEKGAKEFWGDIF